MRKLGKNATLHRNTLEAYGCGCSCGFQSCSLCVCTVLCGGGGTVYYSVQSDPSSSNGAYSPSSAMGDRTMY